MTGMKWNSKKCVMVSLCLYPEILKERKEKKKKRKKKKKKGTVTVNSACFTLPLKWGGGEDHHPWT
jgi:hypothetical protein